MTNTYILVSIVIAIIAIALGAAYTTGALDPVIEKIGIMIFKAEAKAEEKKMEAEGMKEGEDFLAGKSFSSHYPHQLETFGGIYPNNHAEEA